jgi:hypothetical protein
MKAIVARHNGSWEPQLSESPPVYELPMHATEEVREIFRASSSVIFGADFIARLPGGRVFGSGAVLSPDGAAVARDVSVDFGKPFSEHWLLKYGKIVPPTPVKGTTAVVATALGSGYAHWLLEELPRLLVLRGIPADSLIVHGHTPFAEVALRRVLLPAKVILPRRLSHFACEELVVPSLIGEPGYPTSKVVNLLEEFAVDLGDREAVVGERIYLSREKARRRRVTNEDELWPWLQSRGFVKISCEDLTWSEQIAVFRHAKVIVSAHGAALANLVFCGPGTKVVELFHRSYMNGYYWRLASIKSLDYRPIAANGSERLGVDLKANRLDVTADLGEIAKCLSL